MEGAVRLSRKEQHQLMAYSRVEEGILTLREASERLNMSYRQAKRQYSRYRKQGPAGLVHGLRDRPSNHRISPSHRKAVLSYHGERLTGFNLQHASEKLGEAGLPVHPETLRLWLKSEGRWVSHRKKPRRHRRHRDRKPCFGEMVQMDGSFHEWLVAGKRTCMMVMVDDATGITLCRLYEQETTWAAMDMLRRWMALYGIPSSLYTDLKTVYRTKREPTVEEQLQDIQPKTAFGMVCERLDIDLIFAHSPQAKGRVERENGTLQDRAVNEFRYHHLQTLSEANDFLDTRFLPDLNRRFGKQPACDTDLHRSSADLDLDAIFSWEVTRTVNNDWTVRYENRYYQLKGLSGSLPPIKTRVIVQQRMDGAIHIYYRGRELSFQEIQHRESHRHPQPRSIPTRKPWLGTGRQPVADHPWKQSFKSRQNRSTV